MPDWPLSPVLPAGLVHITPLALESLGQCLATSALTSTAWATANLARYVPFRLSQPVKIQQAFTLNGATVAGNIDVGIYDRAGNRLASTGSTAQAGTTAIQTMSLNVLLGPGQYWMALAASLATATFLFNNASLHALRAMGCFQQASAFALPATATFAAVAASAVYMFGVTAQAVV